MAITIEQSIDFLLLRRPYCSSSVCATIIHSHFEDRMCGLGGNQRIGLFIDFIDFWIIDFYRSDIACTSPQGMLLKV